MQAIGEQALTVNLVCGTAIVLANIYQAPAHMGAAYWIPAFWVPALLVSHYVVFRVLVSERPTSEAGHAVAISSR